MSDTPRTDAALLDAKLKHSFPNASFVHADFARQLERDLSRVIGQFNAAVLELAQRPEELERYRNALRCIVESPTTIDGKYIIEAGKVFHNIAKNALTPMNVSGDSK